MQKSIRRAHEGLHNFFWERLKTIFFRCEMAFSKEPWESRMFQQLSNHRENRVDAQSHHD